MLTDKCYHASWHLLYKVPGTYLKSLVKIRSVTAEILMTLSSWWWWVVDRWWVGSGGVGGGGVKSLRYVRLIWGFDKKSMGYDPKANQSCLELNLDKPIHNSLYTDAIFTIYH